MNIMKFFKSSFCILLASLFVFSFSVHANAASTESLTPEQEKAALEQKIKETQNKLDELKVKSADTQEYLDTLNDKIEYMERQFKLVSNEVEADKKQVANLKTKYSENEKLIETAKEDIVKLTDECDQATAEFNESYAVYCKRQRAVYISGETNVLAFLLSSNDISQLLTRYEMVRRIARQDGNLLSEIDNEIAQIKTSREEISKKKQQLESSQNELESTQKVLETAIPQLEEKQKGLDSKKTELTTQRTQANKLLKNLNDKTGNYTEYLENNQAAMDEIDAAIDQAIKIEEEKNTTTSNSGGSGETQSTTKPSSGSSAGKYLSLTYPVPSQTKITCAFHGYSGHSGADFSCPSGSDVVAAESGTVLISADLKNDDGTYRSYGRYIVIMHDKKTSSGNTVYTLYAHNSKRIVSQGEYVKKGQKIAESGSTGNSTGPHVHFEVRTPGSGYSDCKDPEIYLP